jgi:DamX protein
MHDLDISKKRTDDPFAHPRYYLTPELNQRINLIQHLIQNSEQLLFVLAETGCGKTALSKQLTKIAEKHCEHWWMYTLNSSAALSTEALIATILAAFNVRQEGKPIQVLVESLRNHIAATRYNGQLPVLLVDDAHKLPLATLKFIVELAMQGEQLSRMRVVLFCEPQITSILATPEFEMVHNTLIHTLDVPPFSKTQVRDYLQFRLQGTQYTNIHPFSSDVIKKIYSESDGIVGDINLLAQQVLRQFAETRSEQALAPSFSSSSSKWLWGIPIVMLLIAFAIYWYFPKQQALPANESIAQSPVISENQGSLAQMTTEEAFSSFSLPQMPEQVDSTSLNAHSDSVLSKLKPEKETISTEWLGEIKGENWLNHQNPNSYTLQILGAHDRMSLKKFLKKYELENIALFQTTYNTKDWYVLVYGIYSNQKQALAARETLPSSLLESTQPWVRSLASVQKSIQER